MRDTHSIISPSLSMVGIHKIQFHKIVYLLHSGNRRNKIYPDSSNSKRLDLKSCLQTCLWITRARRLLQKRINYSVNFLKVCTHVEVLQSMPVAVLEWICIIKANISTNFFRMVNSREIEISLHFGHTWIVYRCGIIIHT